MITLTLEESVEEYLSGIPSFIEFSTSKPSTVFYTLDGSDPGEDSLIAVGKVYLPSNGSAFTLKAIAISGDDSSSILEERYSTNSMDLDGRRHVDGEGIVVMPYGEDHLTSLGYDAEGSAAQTTDKELADLDLKASSSNSLGEPISNGKTSFDFVNFPGLESGSDKSQVSRVNDNVSFDPSAPFIIMDGSTNEKFENQVVKIVNRTYSTFGPTSKFYDERLGEKEPVVTGNFVKSFYDKKTGTYTSYYWESLESRWIKSIQKVDIPSKKLYRHSAGSKRFVFRWIQDRALSQLF